MRISNNVYKVPGPKLPSKKLLSKCGPLVILPPLLVKSIWPTADGHFTCHIEVRKTTGH